ncbi:MAG: hypothetical protein DRQ88_02370 [Epsilonproteobacteria bacterium]|nr:MAG: hypothetical protein DRQ89_02485 [Campylobacterota bacterium]RLA67514.1 MAG: hypothetical protein DRQ88_02370 [Campylobacterota bacterium]
MRSILLFLFLIISCSTSSTNNEPLGVQLSDLSVGKAKPKIKDGSYGPEYTSRGIDSSEDQKEPVLALVLGPGLNRTLGHAYFLKSLLRNSINIRIISGTGMGAVIASYFASGKSPEKIEWLFYNFLNEVKGKRAFSPQWKSALEDKLLRDFTNIGIQELDITLVIPVFNKINFKIENLKRGSLHSALKAQFRFYHSKMKESLSTPLQWIVYNGKSLRGLGADIVIGVDVLADKIELQVEDGFLYGHYGKMIGKIKKERKDLDLLFALPFADVPLDSEKNLPKNIQLMRKVSEEMVASIKDYIVDWKRRNAKVR